jgi:LuxR family transcriptional regulator, activator of conjugal transfer of Ti plasmids
MNQGLQEFLESLRSECGVENLKDMMARRLEQMGFNRFAYLAIHIPGNPKAPFVITTYLDDWAIHYQDHDYMNVDPVVSMAGQSMLPFEWLSLNNKRRSTKHQRVVLNEATEFGMKAGFTVPIHGPGGAMAALSASSDLSPKEFNDLWDEHKHDIHLMGLYYHVAIGNNILDAETPGLLRLTDRERECLLWAARGKTAWETSEILHISEDTANFHLKNAMRKIGVFGKHHAVVKAIMLGLIVP